MICCILPLLVLTGLLAIPKGITALESNGNGEMENVSDKDPTAELKSEVERQSGNMDFSDWQSYYEELRAFAGDSAEYASVDEMIQSIALSGSELKAETVVEILKDLFIPSLSSALRSMIGVASIAILTGLLGIALGGEGGGTKAMLLLLLCSAAIMCITAVFSELAGSAAETMGRLEHFSAASTPILIGLLTALGCAGSAKILSPTLVFLSDGIIALVKSVILPMLLATGVLTVVDGLTSGLKVARLVKLLTKSVKWLLGLAATVYVAVTAIGGMTAGIADGVSIRTAKYAIDRLVPAAGGMVAGAVDAVIGSSLLLKNAAGTTAIILLVAIAVKPLLQLLGGMFAMRIAAAVCEPFSDERIPKMLDGMAETVSYLFASVAAVVSMFVVTMIIIISTGNMLIG